MRNILKSVFKNKCPQCHQSDVFITKTTNLKNFDKMEKSCSCCGIVFEKEPGFYQGAMYVSYALMVALFVTTWVLDIILFHFSTWGYLTFVIATMIILTPYTFRIARLIWLNFFIKFDKDKTNCKKF